VTEPSGAVAFTGTVSATKGLRSLWRTEASGCWRWPSVVLKKPMPVLVLQRRQHDRAVGASSRVMMLDRTC
jgi:hypothetical protein